MLTGIIVFIAIALVVGAVLVYRRHQDEIESVVTVAKADVAKVQSAATTVKNDITALKQVAGSTTAPKA